MSLPEGDGPVVELRSVTKRFAETIALSAVDFRLEPGVSYGLVGRNGAGKTTLLRLVMGMLRPTEGTVRVLGGDPIEDAERVKVHVGYLAEDQVFPQFLRPRDLLRFFAECYPSWDRDLAGSLIERFEIPLGRRLLKLSKGQARQVALLCAVAHRPRLLVLDEPGGGLDPVARREFLEEVIGLLAAEETTVVFSSHHLHEVERLATRVGILHEGRMLLEAEMETLREGCCRALLKPDGVTADAIRERLPACAAARTRDEGIVVTLFFDAASAGRTIEEALGTAPLEVRPLSLEELFVDLVGGSRGR